MIDDIRRFPPTAQAVRAQMKIRASLMRADLVESIEVLEKIIADPDCVSIALLRSLRLPLDRARMEVLKHLTQDIQDLGKALRRSSPPPEAA